MVTNTQAQVVKDLANRKITVTRHFEAEPELVWQTWTQQELLDQWWAPKPWRAETKKMDFREGGHWLYAMVGPNNEKHWARADFKKIDAPKSFEAADSFCDEKGVKNADLPQTHWRNEFHRTATGTKVITIISSDTATALEKMLEMGFEEGFLMGLDNLEELLSKKQSKK